MTNLINAVHIVYLGGNPTPAGRADRFKAYAVVDGHAIQLGRFIVHLLNARLNKEGQSITVSGCGYCKADAIRKAIKDSRATLAAAGWTLSDSVAFIEA